jgi:hypothetical protein
VLREKRYGQDKAAKYNKNVKKNSRKLCFIPVKARLNGFTQRETKIFLLAYKLSVRRKKPNGKGLPKQATIASIKKRVKNTQFQPRLTVSLHGFAQSLKNADI